MWLSVGGCTVHHSRAVMLTAGHIAPIDRTQRERGPLGLNSLSLCILPRTLAHRMALPTIRVDLY